MIRDKLERQNKTLTCAKSCWEESSMSEEEENLESLESKPPLWEMGADIKPSVLIIVLLVSILPIPLRISAPNEEDTTVSGTPIWTVFDLFTTAFELCDFLMLVFGFPAVLPSVLFTFGSSKWPDSAAALSVDVCAAVDASFFVSKHSTVN